MTYVITQACIGNKDASCTEVCPVDCIHPAQSDPRFTEAEMLHIDPAECIDCDACASSCPVDAIFPADQLPDDLVTFAERNAAFFG
jgi:ferredoxin